MFATAAAVNNFWQFCGGVGALVTALIAVASGAYRYVIVPTAKSVRARKEDIAQQAREHTVELIDQRLDAKLAPLVAEMSTNGGGSLKDRVNAMAADIAALKAETQARWVVLDALAAKADP